MVAEDRRLRPAGYEVYRFGVHELRGQSAKPMLEAFFDACIADWLPSQGVGRLESSALRCS